MNTVNLKELFYMERADGKDIDASTASVAAATRFLTRMLKKDGPLPPGTVVVPVICLTKADFSQWYEEQQPAVKKWMEVNGMGAYKAGKQIVIPDLDSGAVEKIIVCIEDVNSVFFLSNLPSSLPSGYTYTLSGGALATPQAATNAAISWALGTYEFTRYKSENGKGEGENAAKSTQQSALVWPEGCDVALASDTAAAIFMVRDMINTPAEEMSPEHIQRAAEALASIYPGATVDAIVGEKLRAQGYGQIYGVGKAAAVGREPRLIVLKWKSASVSGVAESDRKKVCLVGKGVSFDTGGLDIKGASGMLLMKKDMGGAAHVLGVARMIMGQNLPVDLSVYIPAVENSIAGNAYRPGDVLVAKNGMTTENQNTDAEGRLILADAIVQAETESPQLLVDFATLTGAARTALGPDLPAMFCNDDALAEQFVKISHELRDPVWRMPLWPNYRQLLKSDVADLKNVSGDGSGHAGAVVAALYLQHFLETRARAGASGVTPIDSSIEYGWRRSPGETPWMHIDLGAWNSASKPGKPKGGEAQALRGVFELIKQKFGA
eukprot:GDKI01019962.1.p1 GENE.GDKI01019962.1~~GDKI01019962.1.p1  ORF type:complete len:623 (-),score=162.88 GDKI01019962.1:268-1920(-)